MCCDLDTGDASNPSRPRTRKNEHPQKKVPGGVAGHMTVPCRGAWRSGELLSLGVLLALVVTVRVCGKQFQALAVGQAELELLL